MELRHRVIVLLVGFISLTIVEEVADFAFCQYPIPVELELDYLLWIGLLLRTRLQFVWLQLRRRLLRYCCPVIDRLLSLLQSKLELVYLTIKSMVDLHTSFPFLLFLR